MPENSVAINTQKVLLGGVVSGIVFNALGFASNMLLADRGKAEMDAFKPGLADSMMTGAAMTTHVVLNFILAIALVWTYAAIRPRFGPGMRTATYAALLFWVLAGTHYSGFYFMAMMSGGLWLTHAALGLVMLLVASWAGAKFYSEDVAAS